MKLELRLWSDSDVTQEYVNAHSISKAKYYSGSGARKFDRNTLVDEIKRGRKKGDCFFYGIYQVNHNELIGSIKIQGINQKNKTSDVIPFIFNEKYFEYKLGSASIKLGTQMAFDAHDVRKVFGGIVKNNIGSVKTFLRAGWVVEGIRSGQFLEDGKPADEILVACFNPKYFPKAHFDKYTTTFEEIYET